MGEIITGHTNIGTVVGNSVFIERKGKKIRLTPDSELEAKELGANRPIIEDGDIISTGANCLISINSSGYNDRAKKYANSSILLILPKTKVLLNIAFWEKKSKNDRESSNIITKISLLEGLIGVETTEELETPNAKFEHAKTPSGILSGNGTGYMIIEALPKDETHIYHLTFDDKAGLFVICKKSGAKFEVAKKILGGAGKNFQKDIVVSGGTIYSIPLTQFCERSTKIRSYAFTFLNPSLNSSMFSTKDSDRQLFMQEQAFKNAPQMLEEMPDHIINAVSMVQNLKKMSPAQMKQLGISPEQAEQIKAMMKNVDEEKFSKMAGQFQAASGDYKKNMQKMQSADFSALARQSTIAQKKMGNSAKADMKKMLAELESLPPYAPLKSEYKKA